MAKIELTQNKTVILDDADIELVSGYKWCAFKRDKKYYALTSVRFHGKNTNLLMHMLILGKKPGYEIDHKNNDGLDNRRCNLRHATRSQNNMNKLKSKGTSIYKGVSWSNYHQAWKAQIKKDKVDHHLGYYSSEIEAAMIYNTATDKYFGEFAKPNEF